MKKTLDLGDFGAGLAAGFLLAAVAQSGSALSRIRFHKYDPLPAGEYFDAQEGDCKACGRGEDSIAHMNGRMPRRRRRRARA